MDRDNNWQRTEKSYRVLTQTDQTPDISWEKVIEHEYVHGITDEFIPPTQLHSDATVHNGDGIIFCNIRPDRARQITACFVDPQNVPFITKPVQIDFFITPVKYSSTLPTQHLFNKPTVINTLKEQLAHHDKTIFTIAETEKYAHVTYFFNGEKERAVKTETRVLIPSLKVKNYKQHPHMSAEKITETVLHSLQTDPKDFYLINYANADMVGHTGDYNATIQAIEFLDTQLSLLYDQIVIRMNGTLFITADHGKAEELYNKAMHQPKTAHTRNNVPFIMIRQQKEQPQTTLPLKELSDVAPFILKNMNLPIPNEMKK